MATKKVIEVASADEAKLIGLLCTEIENACEQLTAEALWRRLEQYFFELLMRRETEMTGLIAGWAEAGHPAADRAMWRYIGRMTDLHQFNDMLVQVQNYVVKKRPPVPYPRGQRAVLHLMKYIWIPAVLEHAAAGTGLMPTRKDTTLEAPSVAYYLAIAMRQMKRKIRPLGEQRINKIYWNRHNLAAILEASMPRINPSAK
jgi:hypothetical protein